LKKCKYCGADTTQIDEFKLDFLMRAKLNSLHEVRFCIKCDLGQSYPEISKENLSKFYTSAYGTTLERRSILSKLQTLKYKRDLKLIRKHSARENSTFLDLGAGQGDFVSFLLNSGIQADGIELSESERDKAVSLHNVRLIAGDSESMRIDTKYDCVIMRHVLEHVENPLETLRYINANVLHAGGLIVILVPNLNSWERKIFGHYWHGYDIPRHRFHFTEYGLSQMLIKADYKIVQKRYESNGLDFIRSLQNINYEARNYKFISKILSNRILSLVMLSPVIIFTAIAKPPRILIIARSK
jgi:SAM-dependent methyltransferase